MQFTNNDHHPFSCPCLTWLITQWPSVQMNQHGPSLAESDLYVTTFQRDMLCEWSLKPRLLLRRHQHVHKNQSEDFILSNERFSELLTTPYYIFTLEESVLEIHSWNNLLAMITCSSSYCLGACTLAKKKWADWLNDNWQILSYLTLCRLQA